MSAPKRLGRPPLQQGQASTSLSVRVPNSVYDEANRKAATEQVSMSTLLRRALEHLLKDERG